MNIRIYENYFQVFIDVEKLYAGRFDSSLLENIKACKHFILVLTPNAFDRLLNDTNCEDWMHKEVKMQRISSNINCHFPVTLCI
jgi:hypothetical protein